MNKHSLLTIASILILATFAGPAFAADANFQGNCTYVDPDSFACEFDAMRTPGGQAPTTCNLAVPVRYSWRFGDGATAVTTTPETDHLYVATPLWTPPFIYDVCVSVECSDGSSAYKCHCADLTGQNNIGDCIQAGGWTPR